MNQAEARVPTANGGKYVQQLCKHWAHKMPVELEGGTGSVTGIVTFVGAVATMKTDDETIQVSIRGEDREQVERLKDVVAKHLDRFAFREAPLTYEWSWH